MTSLFPLLVCVSFSVGLQGVLAVNCTENPNGIYEIGCRSYVTCTYGVAMTHECSEGLVYNEAIQSCDLISNVGPPCGLYRDCSNLANNRYPELEHDDDVTHCVSYYTCHNGAYLGHNFCPGDLVFDFDQQICNYKTDVCPVCGTSVHPSCNNRNNYVG